jgi:nucleolar protein 12
VPPPRLAPQQKSRSETQSGRPLPSAPALTASIPKGDPRLGEKIASLSKDERKKVKATDVDRVARRLAKKKAKALADKGVKSKDTGKERVRKRSKDKGATPDRSKSKKRVRSDKALLKMNIKK